jgi:hypothetical protein
MRKWLSVDKPKKVRKPVGLFTEVEIIKGIEGGQ